MRSFLDDTASLSLSVVQQLIMSKESVHEMTFIKSQSDLEKLRNSILHQMATKYAIQTVDCSEKKKPMTDEKNEEKETPGGPSNVHKRKKIPKGAMFEDILAMEKSMKIPTDLEQELISMEERLISKSGKKHISRKCCHKNCKRTAPPSYPNNMYLCDTHKRPLCNKLESYNIAVNRGSSEEREKCKKLKDCHQNIINALKVPDSQQSFGNNQDKYPSNYFTVCMSKLILVEQELSKPLPSNANATLRQSHATMKTVVKKLMDLLIIGRQNLNCHWKEIIEMIVSSCNCIGAGIAWLAANSAFIAVLGGFVGFMVTTIIVGFIFAVLNGDRDAAFVAGAAAFGTGVGALGGVAVEAGVTAGAVIGGPAGALFGAAVGGLVGFGLAAMKKYG